MTQPDRPTRRGRRDPELAARMQQGQPTSRVVLAEDDEYADLERTPEAEDLLNDDRDQNDAYVLLLPGDIVTAKSTLESRDADGLEGYHSFGVQTRVQPDEEPEDAVNRAISLAYGGAERLAETAYQASLEAQEARKSAPIRAQHRR